MIRPSGATKASSIWNSKGSPGAVRPRGSGSAFGQHDLRGARQRGEPYGPPLCEALRAGRGDYQTPPALQPPLLGWSQPRLVVPSAAFVIVKCVPDFDSADTV